MTTKGKIITWVTAFLVVGLAALVYFKFYFVFGEGVKAGELNQIVYKGWVWKTYEGRLIQTGFKGAKGSSGVQSNEFNFSVVNKEIADSLMRCSGKQVELQYKEYFGRLPWRGHTTYIVDSIISVKPAEITSEIPIITGGEEL